MTKKELIDELKKICDKQQNSRYSDKEIDHMNADDLLLKYIDDDNVTDVFEAIDKWYA